jgi:hypothetical protein
VNKEEIIYWLSAVIGFVAKDQIRTEQIAGKSIVEVIDLAKAEANKAVSGSEDLMNK